MLSEFNLQGINIYVEVSLSLLLEPKTKIALYGFVRLISIRKYFWLRCDSIHLNQCPSCPIHRNRTRPTWVKITGIPEELMHPRGVC
jgi:hypothetical protein